MYKETCKTTKFIDFKIQKYSLSMTIQKHSDSHSISESHGKYKCVLSHPIPWDVSHGIPIRISFPWTSLAVPLDSPYLC